MNYTHSTSFAEVKLAAQGRWREILTGLSFPTELLDGRNHPCPKCDGNDRFGMFNDFKENGGVHCRHCHEGGDGFETVAWWLNCTRREALKEVADVIGYGATSGPVARLTPTNTSGQTSTQRSRPKSEAFGTAEEAVASAKPAGFIQAKRWEYTDQNGVLVGFEYRFESDDSKQYRPVTQHVDGWRASGPDGKWPLYRVREVINSDRVFLCEGAKAADAAASIGVVATASAMGARSAAKTDWTPLAGKEVIILPDNDEPGQSYAINVRSKLEALEPPARVIIVELPDLPEKGDICEWLDGFGDSAEPDVIREEFERVVKKVRREKLGILSAFELTVDYHPGCS